MLKSVVRFSTLLIFFWLSQAHAANIISAARVWPAQDYTRLTIESKKSIRHNMFTISNPERLVVDLENVELGAALNDLTEKVGSDDPYIKNLRVGYFKPGVVRLVLDLKSEVKPQLFILRPVGEYGFRLVLDVYPAHPIDPLMALLNPANTVIPDVVGRRLLRETNLRSKKNHSFRETKKSWRHSRPPLPHPILPNCAHAL